MSSITASSLPQNAQSKRSYIATAVFNGSFYSYTSSLNAQNKFVYTLAVNPSATTGNCKAGHVLTENGRRLVPGANPGVTTYMAGVYDSSSGLSGFIDPNCSLFAPYNTNLPNFYARGVDPNLVVGPDGTTNDMGPSVYTSGTVTAEGGITSVAGNVVATAGNVIATAGNIVATAGSVSANTTVTAQKFLTSPVATTVGSSGTPLTASSGRANLSGSGYSTVVYTTQVTATSAVFVTINNATARGVSVVPGAGSFTVYSSINNDNSTFYWLVIN